CEQYEALHWWPNEYLLDNTVSLSKLLDIGPVVLKKHAEHAEMAANNSYKFVSKKGTRVAVFQGTRISSYVSDILGDTVDLAIGYNFALDNGDFKITFSIRSRGDYNCKDFAQANGGGGHTKAAGCCLKVKRNASN